MKTQVAMIDNFVGKASVDFKQKNKLSVKRVSDIINNRTKPFDNCVDTFFKEMANDKEFMKKHEKQIAIIADMWKRAESFSLVVQANEDSSSVIVSKNEDFMRLLVKIIKNVPVDENEDMKNTSSQPLSLIASLQIFLSGKDQGFFVMDRNRSGAVIKSVFDFCADMGVDTPKDTTAGARYQYEVWKQYASLKKFMDETYGTYFSANLMRFYTENGKWNRPIAVLSQDHVYGNFRKESNIGSTTNPKK